MIVNLLLNKYFLHLFIQMITFYFENGSVLTMRTSGTEPKIKYYTEFCAPPENQDWRGIEEELKDIVEKVIDDLFQPDLNNLIKKH